MHVNLYRKKKKQKFKFYNWKWKPSTQTRRVDVMATLRFSYSSHFFFYYSIFFLWRTTTIGIDNSSLPVSCAHWTPFARLNYSQELQSATFATIKFFIHIRRHIIFIKYFARLKYLGILLFRIIMGNCHGIRFGHFFHSIYQIVDTHKKKKLWKFWFVQKTYWNWTIQKVFIDHTRFCIFIINK